MAAVPGIRPPKLSPFWDGFYMYFSLFISMIFGKSPFAVGIAGDRGGRGPDHLAQLEQHPSGGG